MEEKSGAEEGRSRPVMMRIGSSTALHLGQEDDQEDVPLPPDGGWGWVIVISSFMCNLILDGAETLFIYIFLLL